ncbi:hypothetical protein CBR_g8203 [Chara braunii]|uniref:Uncharacterized protein n=1 Tax=Chara braunii TaxID=69332 RepID=A0A388KLI4_CHABU|nr:hypothetical protein CBR_g8203 [Chara braunii]|eukprot:GBG70902.1 hypothetical protein CBR_g8203 [Chara braunii]
MQRALVMPRGGTFCNYCEGSVNCHVVAIPASLSSSASTRHVEVKGTITQSQSRWALRQNPSVAAGGWHPDAIISENTWRPQRSWRATGLKEGEGSRSAWSRRTSCLINSRASGSGGGPVPSRSRLPTTTTSSSSSQNPIFFFSFIGEKSRAKAHVSCEGLVGDHHDNRHLHHSSHPRQRRPVVAGGTSVLAAGAAAVSAGLVVGGVIAVVAMTAMSSSSSSSSSTSPTSSSSSSADIPTANKRQEAIAATRRGMKKFIDGDVGASLADFDLALQLDPSQRPYLWQRGLSLYYLDQFEEAARQFREDVAVNPNDTEEAIWCFLAEARIHGPDEARRAFLQVGRDSRPIMRAAHDLFKNGGSVDDLLAAAGIKELGGGGGGGGGRGGGNGGHDQFYALLYTGLFHESQGEELRAKEAMIAAVKTMYGQISGDYMAKLAQVHCQCRGWVVS